MIQLTEKFLLGKGGNQIVYIHPEDPAKCIKLNLKDSDDHNREMAYRRSRERRHLPPSTLLTAYYGDVETSLGTGSVFERIMDYDGETSRTIDELIRLEMTAREQKTTVRELLHTEKEIPAVTEALLRFRRVLFEEKIIIPDMGAENFMVQFIRPDEWKIRIVDDIGSPTLIPIVYYIDYFAAGHVRRRWNRFIREIEDVYAGFLSKEEKEQLKTV